MKKLFIPLLAIGLLAGCSKDESKLPEDNGSVRIELSAGVPAVTKSPVNNGDKFTVAVAGWESESSVDYATAPEWYNTLEITASATNTPVELNPVRTYHADNAVKTHILAWHPAGEPANGKITFTNTDGQTDAMTASHIVGSARDYQNKVLAFTHPTTQLIFLVKADNSLDSDTKIRSIKVKSVQIPVGFDITANGGLEVRYAGAADLSIPGIAEEAIAGTAAQAGNPVMIKPLAGNKIMLDVETSKASFSNVEAAIDDDTDFMPGKAYAITLTFKQSVVELKATVTPWDYSGSGSGIIE